MMRKLCIYLILLIILTSIYGCSSDDGISEEEYHQVKTDLAQVRQQLATAQSELSEVESTCPPGRFATLDELKKWARANVQSGPVQFADEWYLKAVKVQRAGLDEGYLISINIEYIPEADSYTVSCNAMAGDQLFWWDPENGEVFDWGPDFKLQ